MYELTREDLFQETEGILEALCDPKFIKKMQTFRSKKGQDRLEYAEAEMTPQKLSNEGIPLPAKMRVSSRVFEPDVDNMEPDNKYFSGQEGFDVAERILKRSELVAELEAEHPEVLNDLKKFTGIDDVESGTSRFQDEGSYELAGPWACGCGGAVSACGGAGGGTVVA